MSAPVRPSPLGRTLHAPTTALPRVPLPVLKYRSPSYFGGFPRCPKSGGAKPPVRMMCKRPGASKLKPARDGRDGTASKQQGAGNRQQPDPGSTVTTVAGARLGPQAQRPGAKTAVRRVSGAALFQAVMLAVDRPVRRLRARAMKATTRPFSSGCGNPSRLNGGWRAFRQPPAHVGGPIGTKLPAPPPTTPSPFHSHPRPAPATTPVGPAQPGGGVSRVTGPGHRTALRQPSSTKEYFRCAGIGSFPSHCSR